MVALSCRINYKSIIISSFLIILITFFFNNSILSAENISDKKNEFEQIQEELKDASKKAQEYQKEEKNLLSQVEEIDKNLVKIQRELNDIQVKLGNTISEKNKIDLEVSLLEKNLKVRELNLKKLQNEIDTQDHVLNERISAIYKRGELNYLEVILESKNFYDFVTRVSFLNLIYREDQRFLGELSEKRENAELEKAQAEKEKEELEVEQEKWEKKKREIENWNYFQTKKKSELSDKIERKGDYLEEVKEKKQYYQELEDELEKTSKELINIIKRLGGSNPDITYSGQLLFPVNGTISSPFGMRWHPILNEYRMHYGIDIAAPQGTNIKAAEDGIVLFAGWLNGYGLTMIIDHGSGITTLYAHTSALKSSLSEYVLRGEVIGYVGSTGFSTGPHLHFEVRQDGTAKNPQNYF